MENEPDGGTAKLSWRGVLSTRDKAGVTTSLPCPSREPKASLLLKMLWESRIPCSKLAALLKAHNASQADSPGLSKCLWTMRRRILEQGSAVVPPSSLLSSLATAFMLSSRIVT